VAGPLYTHAELENLWMQAGGNPLHADVAAAIAQAESGGCQYAKAGPTDDRPVKECSYRHTTLENSYGLWQINRRAHPTYTAHTLYTALGNARAAVAISRNGANFRPWTTFVRGAHLPYLAGAPGGTQPGAGGGSSGGSSGGGSPIEGGPSTSLGGWNALMRQLAGTLPTALHHAQTVRRAALRELAGRRKVTR